MLPTVLFVIAAVVLSAGGVAVASGLLRLPTWAESAPTPTATATATKKPTPEYTRFPTVTPTPVATPTEPVIPTPPPPPPRPPSAADTACATATTLSIWAHYDDDLIFLNPTLDSLMAGGDCIRTIFLTGSDAGKGHRYADGRELGILRAYNQMRGVPGGLWTENKITLNTGVVLSQWSPDGDPDITIGFLRLPDGGLNAQGFSSTGNVSLPMLYSGNIATMAPLDGSPAISLEAMIGSLSEIIQAYGATRLYTAVPATSATWTIGDHPDHATTGAIVRAAWQRAGFPIENVQYAVGYPSEQLGVNVLGDQLTRKLSIYRIYAAQDHVVACATDAECLAKPRFGSWLQRSYLMTDPELFPGG